MSTTFQIHSAVPDLSTANITRLGGTETVPEKPVEAPPAKSPTKVPAPAPVSPPSEPSREPDFAPLPALPLEPFCPLPGR